MAKKGPKPKPIADRFWPKVDRRSDEECWEWTGTRYPSGYGRFFVPGNASRAYAHRVAYALRYRAIPEGLIVMHRCDNPPCCNPAHLRLGTRADNNRDRSNKGRGRENRQWGAENPRATLTEKQVREIVRLYQSGVGQFELAERFGVKQPQISRIVRRKEWTHLWS